MNGKVLLVSVIGFMVSLALGAGLFLVSRSGSALISSQPAAEETRRLPNIFLPGLDGEMHSISELAGKPGVINFWATWCRPCEEEMPLLQVYSVQYPQVSFIGINSGEDAATVQPFVDKYDITFPIWLDSDEKATVKMKIFGLPTTYFIDSKGIIQATHLGQLSPELLDEYLAKLEVEP